MTDKKEQPYKFYIFVNTSLNMGPGKACSQVGHVVQQIIEKIVKEGCDAINDVSYDTLLTGGSVNVSQEYMDYLAWKEKPTKVVLKASGQQILELAKDKNACYIIDDGDVKIKKGSVTAVGFPPCNRLNDKFKEYQLL